MNGQKNLEQITSQNVMNFNNKLIIGSLIFNALLVVALVLFVIFGRTKPIPKYEAEIATLTTLNNTLLVDNKSLVKTKAKDDDDIAKYDENLIKVSKELIKSKDEIKRLNRVRHAIPNTVADLPNDSVAGEFTDYLQRRNKRKTK